jgi:hypothetical protein
VRNARAFDTRLCPKCSPDAGLRCRIKPSRHLAPPRGRGERTSTCTLDPCRADVALRCSWRKHRRRRQGADRVGARVRRSNRRDRGFGYAGNAVPGCIDQQGCGGDGDAPPRGPGDARPRRRCEPLSLLVESAGEPVHRARKGDAPPHPQPQRGADGARLHRIPGERYGPNPPTGPRWPGACAERSGTRRHIPGHDHEVFRRRHHRPASPAHGGGGKALPPTDGGTGAFADRDEEQHL